MLRKMAAHRGAGEGEIEIEVACKNTLAST